MRLTSAPKRTTKQQQQLQQHYKPDTHALGGAGGLELKPDERRLLLLDVLLVAENALAVQLPHAQVEGVALAKALQV